MQEDSSTPDNDPAANKEATEDPRIFCFERPKDLTAFEFSVTKLIGRLQEREQSRYVSPRNVLRMNHGRQWVHSARGPEPDTSMHSISTEWLLPFKDIADNELGLIARSILPVSEDMSRQLTQRMYGVVSAAAESAGNVVDAKIAGSITASFIEMMSKIEFGVDRDGNVSMPQIHVGPETYDKLAKALDNMEPGAAAELERLKEEKSQQALQREAVRRAKFRRAED